MKDDVLNYMETSLHGAAAGQGGQMEALAHDEQQRVTGEQRESIWSVSKGVKHVYFALFILQFTAGTIGTVAQGVESLAALWHDLSALAITVAAVSMVLTETGRYVMVLAAAFEEWREKRRQEQIARAVAEALAKERRGIDAEWDAWNERRVQAEQRGEPFEEPSPSARRRASEAPQQQA